MIGVGEGPWDACRVFDTRLPGRYAYESQCVTGKALIERGAKVLLRV